MSKSPRGSNRIANETNLRLFSNAVTSGETLRENSVRFVCYSVTRDALIFSLSRPRARVCSRRMIGGCSKFKNLVFEKKDGS